MSIASELTALNGYILGAYDEVNDKGGTVPQNKNMANLATAIASISGGGGGGGTQIEGFNLLSGTVTPTEVTGTLTLMTYNDFLAAVGGSVPAKMFAGVFDPNAAYQMTGFAYRFGAKGSSSTPHYGNGGNITRGGMNNSVSIDTFNNQINMFGYNNLAAGKFQTGVTYIWFILWKN